MNFYFRVNQIIGRFKFKFENCYLKKKSKNNNDLFGIYDGFW